MDIFDKLALSMRRYEPVHTARQGSERFDLIDLMEMYSKQSILELQASRDGKRWSKLTPDEHRKLKVSLLDSISELSLPQDAWFSVGQTAPSGDYSKVHIDAHGRGNEDLGQIDMLLGRRNYAYYYADDPVLGQIDVANVPASSQTAPPESAADKAAQEKTDA
jgi:hypothetical protein